MKPRSSPQQRKLAVLRRVNRPPTTVTLDEEVSSKPSHYFDFILFYMQKQNVESRAERALVLVDLAQC